MNNYEVYDADGNLIDVENLVYNPPKPHRTKEEWLKELETSWITPNQQGIIVSKFNSLGIGRDERLQIISWLIGKEISSTRELKQGEAGLLIKRLENVYTVDDLYDLLPDEYWDEDEDNEGKDKWFGIVLVIAGIVIALS